jgi:putative spermidine/putrescine transport system permease protein
MATCILSRKRFSRGADVHVFLLAPAALFVVLFFLLPFLTVAVRSVTPSTGMRLELHSFTLVNYVEIVASRYYWDILARTFWISAWVTFWALCLGYPIAYFIVRRLRSRTSRRLAYFVVLVPLFTSGIVRAFGWIVLLGRQGFVNTMALSAGLIRQPLPLLFNDTGVIIGLVHVLVSFIVLAVASVLQNIDAVLDEAAQDLGAGPWQTFRCITWPLSMPGVLAGATIVFTLAASSYVVPSLLGGGRVQVLGTLVFQQFMVSFNWAFGSALSLVLLASVLLAVGAATRFASIRR